MGAFFQGPAAPGKTVEKIPGVIKEITEKTGGTIKNWGAVGFCWGGKVRLRGNHTGTDRANPISRSFHWYPQKALHLVPSRSAIPLWWIPRMPRVLLYQYAY